MPAAREDQRDETQGDRRDQSKEQRTQEDFRGKETRRPRLRETQKRATSRLPDPRERKQDQISDVYQTQDPAAAEEARTSRADHYVTQPDAKSGTSKQEEATR